MTLADPNKHAFCNVLKFTMMSNFLNQCSKFLLTVPNVPMMIGIMTISCLCHILFNSRFKSWYYYYYYYYYCYNNNNNNNNNNNHNKPKNQFGLSLQLPSMKFLQCQAVQRNILKSSLNENVRSLWKITCEGSNIQYDLYRNTKEVLKAVRTEHTKRLQHELTSQGCYSIFSD